MLKKFMCAGLIITVSMFDAFAAPSVKKLGLNKTNKPVVVNQQQSDNKTNAATIVKSAKTPSTQVGRSATNSRFMSISSPLKKIKSIKANEENNTNTIKPDSGNSGGTSSTIIKPVNSGVSSDKINEAFDRIEALETETEKAVKDVVEQESGTYVTDVVLDGNTINVNKTRLLYAPVRTANSDEISGDAEIWIIK